MTSYGQKDGAGPTAGKKATLFLVPLPDGSVFRKRVFIDRGGDTLIATGFMHEGRPVWSCGPANLRGKVTSAALSRRGHPNPMPHPEGSVEVEEMKQSEADFVRVFTEAGDFNAFNAAEAWLASLGFSTGSMERDQPIGIMFGDFGIAKWRNLRQFERDALHGTITGSSKRNGPVTVTIFATAPKAAHAAILKATQP